jgi:predicted AAA+ superfamily ATPase
MSLYETAISEIKRKINDLRSTGIPSYVSRDVSILAADRVVSVIVGARRCGKSFRCYQEIHELLRSGWLTSINCVCAIDFDNPHLGGMAAIDLGGIRDTFLSMTPAAGPGTHVLFLFDEIHRIDGWEDFVVDLSRNVDWRVIVTGSSSRMLKTDISTTLRGKSLSTVMYPLSFREFLRFRNIDSTDSTQGRAQCLAAFQDYLMWGGYPQVAQTARPVREALLREYFDTMILKDILQRYNVSRPVQCFALYRYLLALSAKPFTQNSALKFLRQSGFQATGSLLADYITWADDSWFLFGIPIFSDSLAEINRNYRKCYCIDWGLATQNSQVWDGTYSRAFENMVYIHLRRLFPRVNYCLTRSRRQEIDFIGVDSGGKPAIAVQACMKLGDESVLEREVPPLAATAAYFGINEALVITTDEDRTIELDGIKVRVVPAWRWMK